jgi:phosphatidate phosphatase LPIN
MWEWGAFPQKSATKTKFSDLPEPDILSWKGTTPSSFPNESVLSRSYSLPTESGFGIGGRLRPDREDPYIFTLLIEGKTVQFELSLVPVYRRRSPGSLGSNEVESAEIFNHSRLDFWRFIDDEQVLVDDDLVLRWGGDRCVSFIPISSILKFCQDISLVQMAHL